MKIKVKHQGVVVPMITPVTREGTLDEPAVDRVVDFLIAGGVDGIFILGTTGEGAAIPTMYRRRLMECTVARVKGRVQVYAGIGDEHPEEIDAGNDYLQAGVDALVSRPPVELALDRLPQWYETILNGLDGPLLIYNMPMTTKVSIPLDVIAKLLGHPRLAGIKDSENNPRRIEELLKRFGGRPDFSVFIGVGALMELGRKLGADGIVPSVGNLVPEVCGQFDRSASKSDWGAAGKHFAQMNAVAALYQKGRNLNESLAALKAAMHCRGLCSTHVMPPLRKVSETELEKIRLQMRELHLLNGK
jgi:dihydrodipicolinate synthase/N-acetylneuraminate lyase